MKIEGLRLDTVGPQPLRGGSTVEAIVPPGETPNLFPGQRFNATVVALDGKHALIELNGASVAFAALQDLQLGAELFVKVAQVAPKLLLELSPQPAKSSSSLPPLTVGQEVDAEVIEELSDGAVLVNIAGALLEAETPEHIPVGKTFSARVEQLRPQVVLHVVGESLSETDALSDLQAQATRLLRENIPHHAATGESLKELTRELASFVDHPPLEALPASVVKLQALIKKLLPEQATPTAERLATFVRDGGLHYEAKLFHAAEQHPQDLPSIAEEDLKGLLLQALTDLKAAQPEELASRHSPSVETKKSFDAQASELLDRTQAEASTHDITTSLTHHLEHIESQQAVNLLAQAQGEPYQLQIPLFTGQGITTAFLSIEPDDHGAGERGEGQKGSGNGHRILFLLDLEGFGQTRIDAHIGETSLWVAFYVDQDPSIALLRAELPKFRETLQAFGYEEVLLVAKPLGQLPPEKRKKFEALTIGAPTSVHLLDVKA